MEARVRLGGRPVPPDRTPRSRRTVRPLRLLVTGFGPFGDVVDNPASRLARALDGAVGPGFTVVGREIPVSYARGPAATVAAAREVRADHVLGVGVAVQRTRAELERFGRAHSSRRPDVDGICTPELAGPAELCSTLDVERWAQALGCSLSNDAGTYVCNAWLHQVRQQLDVPVGFLHIPRDGVEAGWFLTGLERLLTSPDAP